MNKGIATGLLLASVILLIVYGADVMIGSSFSSEGTGFLPLNESIRGGVFGGGAVVMSIIGFVLARKEHAPAVSALLIINGGLIITGMLALIGQGALASEDSMAALRTIGSTIVMGAILVGLGVWKIATDKNLIAPHGDKPAQQ